MSEQGTTTARTRGAFKLSKDLRERLDAAVAEAEDRKTELETALTAYNDQMAVAAEAVELAVGALNEELEAVKAVIWEAVGDWRSTWDDRSERWQESEKGQATSSFIEEWENFADEIVEVSVDLPEEVDTPELPTFDVLPAEEPEE